MKYWFRIIFNIIVLFVFLTSLFYLVFFAVRWFKSKNLDFKTWVKQVLTFESLKKSPSSVSKPSTKPAKQPPSKPETPAPKPPSPPVVEPDAGKTQPVVEPYVYGKSKLKIASVSRSRSGKPSVLVLSPSLKKDETLDLGGWKIKTKTDEFFIPQAVEIFSQMGPNETQNLVLKSNDRVNIYSTASKVGKNFRLNKCTGYLETAYRFNPSLPLDCPRLYRSRADIVDFSNFCQDYITSLKTCEYPAYNLPIPYYDSGCRGFLDKLNYTSCVERHRGDADFLSREWRLFLSAPRDFFISEHDRIRLLNKDGELIHEYIY
jgi:hypothetical protein